MLKDAGGAKVKKGKKLTAQLGGVQFEQCFVSFALARRPRFSLAVSVSSFQMSTISMKDGFYSLETGLKLVEQADTDPVCLHSSMPIGI